MMTAQQRAARHKRLMDLWRSETQRRKELREKKAAQKPAEPGEVKVEK